MEKNLLPTCDKYNLRWKDAENGAATEGDIIRWALMFPSIREGWRIPVTEAGCVGTPSIVYDLPGIREVADYGRTGNDFGEFIQVLLQNK